MVADVYFGKKIYQRFILSVSPHVTRRLLSTHFSRILHQLGTAKKGLQMSFINLKRPFLPAQLNWICGLQTEATCVLILPFAGAPRPSFEKTYGRFPRNRTNFTPRQESSVHCVFGNYTAQRQKYACILRTRFVDPRLNLPLRSIHDGSHRLNFDRTVIYPLPVLSRSILL